MLQVVHTLPSGAHDRTNSTICERSNRITNVVHIKKQQVVHALPALLQAIGIIQLPLDVLDQLNFQLSQIGEGRRGTKLRRFASIG